MEACEPRATSGAGSCSWPKPQELAEVLDRDEEATALTAEWFDPWAMPEGRIPIELAKPATIEKARRNRGLE